jgi:dihydrofolate reductase
MNGQNSSHQTEITLICAMAEHGVIGRENRLLWKLPDDMVYFRKTTLKHTVIMGRKTYESIGNALPKRRNIVLTRQTQFSPNDCEIVTSVEEALVLCQGEETVFVIGGAEVYRLFLPMANRLLITHLHHTWDGDAFFPQWDEKEWIASSERVGITSLANPYLFTFREYKRKSPGESE